MKKTSHCIACRSCARSLAVFAAVFGFAALFPLISNADVFAKLSGGEFRFYGDAECTAQVDAPATGLEGVTVLFADDAEYQALIPYTNELATAAAVAIQNDLTLTADADWRAIDFDLNGKAIVLKGYDLQVRKPQGTGRIDAGNLINPLSASGTGSSTWHAGSGWWGVGTASKKDALWWNVIPPKSRKVYVSCKTKKYNSTYYQYIFFSVAGQTFMNYSRTDTQGERWWGPWSKDVTAGSSFQVMVRRDNGYSHIGFVTISPESHLIFDIPEGEEFDTANISFGGASASTYEGAYGLGLRIRKTGKGTLFLNKEWTMATQAGEATSVVVEEGLVKKGAGMTAGGQYSKIVVEDGAQFDMHGAAGSNSACYDFTISGAGVDGLGAIVNNTEVPNAYDTSFSARNITLATNAVIGGTQKFSLKNGDWTATTMTMGGHSITYTNTTVYAGNVTYSGAGSIIVPEGAALSFYAHNSAAADCDVTVHGALNQNCGGFTSVKSLVFEAGSSCWLSDSAGSGSIPVTVVTERYVPNGSHANGGDCTLTTPKVQLGDASHLEPTLDLTRFDGAFDGTNTTFYAGSTVTVALGNREFAGSALLVAWDEMPTAVFAVDDVNKERLGLLVRADGLYVFPGKVPSFVKYDTANDRWAYYDDELNPFDGEWKFGLKYMKAVFSSDAEFRALAQRTEEMASNHVAVLLQDDVTLTADADWRAIDFEMNGKTITLMGNTLTVHKPKGVGRITAGNLITNGGFEDGGSGWVFGANSGTVTASGYGVSANTCKDKPFAGNHWCVIGSANDTAGATTHFNVLKDGVHYIRFRFAKYDSDYASYGVDCGIDSANNVAYHVNVKPYPGGKSSDVYKKTLTAGTHAFIFGRYYAYILVDEAAVSPESHLVFDIPEGEEFVNTGIAFGATQNYFFDGAGLQVHKTGKGKLTLARVNGNFAGNGATSLVVEDGLVVNACADGQTFCGEQYSTIEIRGDGQFDFNGHRYHDYHYVLAGSGPDGSGALVNNAAMSNPWTVDGSKRGMFYNVKLADDATIGGTNDLGMIFYDNGAHTMTMNGNTVTYSGTKIFAGQMNYSGDGKIVVATNATLQSCTSSATAGGCDVEVYGILAQQDGKVLSPVKSLVFAEGSRFYNQKGTPSAVTVYGTYAPNAAVKEGSTAPHPIVQLGDADHPETTLDLSRWTGTFDDSVEGSLTFQAGSTVTVDIGERTSGLGKPAYLWKEAPDPTVKFATSASMRRRSIFVVPREDGLYFKSGLTLVIR